jgi:heme/copper-type cytochrome/quinol oxidase subunit 2
MRAIIPRYLACSLVDILFWIAVVCCVIAQVAIARSTLGAPARGGELRPGIPRPRRSIEIAWTVLPAVGLALALVMTWRAIHRPAVTDDRPPVVFERVSSNT